MNPVADPQLTVIAGGGVIGGLVLLARGFGGYRAATRISDTAPSRIASVAVGEVLVSGIVDVAELTLVSPLQSTPCVYYRARVEDKDGEGVGSRFDEERAVGFRVRDETGALRVFPRGARFDVPARFDERTGTFGDEPPGLMLRTGSAFGATADRESQIAALLTVHPASTILDGDPTPVGLSFGHVTRTSRSKHYVECRIEPGDVVTIMGRALPFDQLADPTGADELDGGAGLDDPEIAADLAAARATGTLETDPERAWGNAAIPGFGIGHPVRAPELDPAARPAPIAPAAEADRIERMFDIDPEALVVAAADEVPLLVSVGTPSIAAGRQERLFLVGLLGAILAIGSAMALAALVGGIGG